MVAIDYSFRDSEYYTKWYKQGIVPADNLFMGYQFVTGALGTITSIFSALKSDDTEGGGGTLNGTPVADDDGPTVEEKTQIEKIKTDFIKKYQEWEKNPNTEPSSQLKSLADEILKMDNIDNVLKEKANCVKKGKK